MRILTTALGLFVSLNANATGGFSCEWQDAGLKFEIGGVTSRSFENEVVQLNAELTGTAGDDGLIFNADQNFTKQDLRQYWNSGEEFRVNLYAESEEKNTWITIMTRGDADGEIFRGTISVKQTSAKAEWSVSENPIECFLE